MHRITYLLFVLIFIGCEQREFNNPYDPFSKISAQISLTFLGTEINILKVSYSDIDRRAFNKCEVYYSKTENIEIKNENLYKVITNYDSTKIYLYGLEENETYYFIARLIDVLDREVNSQPLMIRNGNYQPPIPRFVNTYEVEYNQIKIRWYQADIKDFLKYEIYYSTLKNFPINSINLYKTITQKSDTVLIIGNLKPNTDYYFKLRLYDQGNLFSDSEEKMITSGNDIPTAVLLNDIINATDTSLSLSWSKNSDEDFLKYEIHCSNNSGFIISNQTLVKTIYDRDITNTIITNLLSNRMYYFKIRVYDKGGLYIDSNEKSGKTLPPMGEDIPKPVVLESPTEITQTSMRLTWSQYTESDFKHYELHYSTEQNFILTSSNIYLGALTNQNLKSIVVLGLNPNTKYYFRLRIVNKKDKFADSEEVSGTTLP